MIFLIAFVISRLVLCFSYLSLFPPFLLYFLSSYSLYCWYCHHHWWWWWWWWWWWCWWCTVRVISTL